MIGLISQEKTVAYLMRKNNMTQKDRLLNYLKQYQNINPMESWQQLGIYRLSAVILMLRKEGYNIRTDMVEVLNRFNEVCRVARYVLEPK